MKHSLLFALTASMLTATPAKGLAQEQLYPHHFNLSEVTLLDSPMKQAMDLNIRVLLDYDTDRLLTPFIRQAGLTTGRYTNWLLLHPNFKNWGGNGFDLSGHVGGHYLSALAMALPSPWPMPPARTSRLALCSSRDSTICSVF